MEDRVGKTAGDIWHYLKKHGDSPTLKVRMELDLTQSQFYLAVGWLLREGNVQLRRDDQGFRISLKQSVAP
ncbi:MAG TPA: winged helix-turn-helix domain-containing protein [Elusimicrobiota bacterium]|nr:winged helix-turn-helix domain-containing protein [Elusimicrobiota bacterium]